MASYKYFDMNNKEITYLDLQDKSKWCSAGEKIEDAFIRLFGKQFNLVINPNKKDDRYAPDLLNTKTGKLGDLKFQGTPFFMANSLYKIDPTYAIVFNVKDKERYEEKYPELEIYYWVNWIPVKFQMGKAEVNVLPLSGIWKTDFQLFNTYLAKCFVHEYGQRIDDKKGNARDSFVCDIRNEVFEHLL